MIPVHKKAADLVKKDFKTGNFGLYFNKYVNLSQKGNEAFKIGDNEINAWLDKYNDLKQTAKALLEQRHHDQADFLQNMQAKGFETVVVTAILISPMMVGMGESHPSENGLLFDRNMGVLYIPAGSIKGLARLSHVVRNVLQDENGNWKPEDEIAKLLTTTGNELDESRPETNIPLMFGLGGDKDARRGGVVFLDAFPKSLPTMKVEIMNPHYPDYYKTQKRGPTEDQDPNPIKFLAVDQGTQFIFRAVVTDKKHGKDIRKLLESAIEQALTMEGVGAKTAVGYGRFSIDAIENGGK